MCANSWPRCSLGSASLHPSKFLDKDVRSVEFNILSSPMFRPKSLRFYLQARDKSFSVNCYLFTVYSYGPSLWSSGQSSWLQIQRPGFDSHPYQIFWEVVGLERGPLSLVTTIEELLERKSSGSGLEIREYGSKDPSRWPRASLYPQKLALISPTSGGRSVGIVRSRTQAKEFSLVHSYEHFFYGLHSHS
jgi:hypothetical protein